MITDYYSNFIISSTINFDYININNYKQPVVLFYDVLYANKMLLKKYNHRVPRTWDELIEISKFIICNEKLMNNTNIIGYNGEFTGIN